MTRDANTNVFFRNDTIFGTCQAIGDEFGFNPNWLRIPLATAVLVSPTGIFAVYVGLSLVVLASRLWFRPKQDATMRAMAPAAAVEVEANDDRRELIAA